MKSKIKNTIRQARDGDLANIAYRIIGSLKDNPHFPSPTPELAVVETALQDYRDALVGASKKDKALVAVKNEKRLALQSLLTELGNYVTETSQGELVLLLTSGFDLVRQRGEAILPSIDGFVVEIGPPGVAVTRVRPVAGARSYVHQYTTDPNSGEKGWVSITSTDREFRFIQLESAVRYWFRVIAIGYGNQAVYSTMESRIIQ